MTNNLPAPLSDPNKLDYPYLVAHFHMETDTGVFPIEADANIMVALILQQGDNSDVCFYAPDGTVVAVSDYDNGIALCFDQRFLVDALLPALERMRAAEHVPDIPEADVPADEWAIQYDRYYESPYFGQDQAPPT